MIQKFALRMGPWVCAIAAAVSARGLLAQPPGSWPDEEAAVRQAAKECLAAMERGDKKAILEFWTADGTFTDENGRTYKIRELLEKKSEGGNAGRVQTKGSNARFRFLNSEAAIEEGDCETITAENSTPTKGSYTALWVRQNGRWKIDNLREMRSETPPAGGQLASLDVFAGEWSGEMNKMAVRLSAHWDASKKFMHRELTIAAGDKASLGGRQEIGWDPTTQHIKSWMFNDDGSYGEGVWSLEGNVWMVLSSRVFPDGKTSTATQIYKFPDKHTLVWKVIRGSIDGQPTEDFEVVLKRKER